LLCRKLLQRFLESWSDAHQDCYFGHILVDLLACRLLPYLEAPVSYREWCGRRCCTRDGTVNWRTKLLRIIRKAGLKPWPKLFHNLRASRQNELMQQFPIHVVRQWLGTRQQSRLDPNWRHVPKTTPKPCNTRLN
jgi:hypothetical protein